MHKSVMLEEVIKYLNPKSGDIIVDATFGLGGHGKEILKKVGDKGLVIGFEKDESIYKRSEGLLKTHPNVRIINLGYETIKKELSKLKIKKIDGVIFDLGVCSLQLDESNKGFSFRKDDPLDMRFSVKQKMDASYIVNTFSDKDLADIIYKYGEERFAKRIARKIVEYRKTKSIVTTIQLANIVRSVMPKNQKKKIHPATRTFQALRIAVNDELNVIERGIESVLPLLNIGARIVVISFHSLEDRIVKTIFLRESKDCICTKIFPVCQCNHKASLKLLDKSIIKPSEEEIKDNPRSRSSKMRVAEKI